MLKHFKAISIAEIARRMGKSRNWFYQRLHEYNVNGKPAKFTETQKVEIVKILRDIQKEIDLLIDLFLDPT